MTYNSDQRTEGMAAARKWRDTPRPALLVDPSCAKCGDTGIIATWGGGKGIGSRVGPCPRCRPDGAKRFLAALAREVFGDPDDRRERRFKQVFTRGE